MKRRPSYWRRNIQTPRTPLEHRPCCPTQSRAADQIARRFATLRDDPERPMETKNWETPFYQALSAITGTGKTAIAGCRHPDPHTA